MKKIHIILIILIAVSIGVIVTSLGDSSTYVTFSEAFDNQGSEYHIVGKLDKDTPTQYNPEENPDLFKFSMVDNNGEIKPVVLLKSKPQDFERSEQIVLIGKANGNHFLAREILLKCPSKYEDGTPQNTQTEPFSQNFKN